MQSNPVLTLSQCIHFNYQGLVHTSTIFRLKRSSLFKL